MKRIFTIVAAILMTAATAIAQSEIAPPQTMTVSEGNVLWVYDAVVDNVPMTFASNQLAIKGRTYSLAAQTTISVEEGTAPALIVNVDYTDAGARVTAPGALADRLNVSVSGSTVDITASAGLAEEVTYVLSGRGESFALHGDYKSTIVLQGVSLAAKGAQPALWVDNGKRIEFQVAEGTTNTFVDAASNQKKSAFFVKGHAEWKGAGSVSISGTSRHAYSSNEYTLFKNSFTGTFTVPAAGSDGIHVEQYLDIRSGTFNISGTQGDGIDVGYALEDDGKTPTNDEFNGEFRMQGGTVNVVVERDDTKGVKCESNMTILAGRINATANGDGSRGVQTSAHLYLGVEGGSDAKAAYIYLTANGGEWTDPATGDANKCRGLKVKQNFYHYPSTVERDANSALGKKKIVDVDGTYFKLGGTLSGITIE